MTISKTFYWTRKNRVRRAVDEIDCTPHTIFSYWRLTLLDLDNALRDQPAHRLLHGLQRGVARVIVQQPLSLGEAAARAVGDVVPGGGGLFRRGRGFPFFPRQGAELGRATTPGGR